MATVIKHTNRKLATIYGELNELLEKAEAALELEASSKLASLFCDAPEFPAKREKIFESFNRIYPERTQIKTLIPSFEEKIWERSDKVLLTNLVIQIAEQETVDQFKEKYEFGDFEEALEWLNTFVKLLIEAKEEALLNEADYPILPDQNGRFRIKDDLLEGLFVDDDLKDISAKLGHDFRDELINDRIVLSFSASRTMDDSVVIEKIKTLVASLLVICGKMRIPKRLSACCSSGLAVIPNRAPKGLVICIPPGTG